MDANAAETAFPRANRVMPIPAFELGGALTPEQEDYFETYGFIRFRRFLPRARATALYGAMLEITERLLKEGTRELFGVPLITGRRNDGTPYIQRIPFASLQHAAFHELLQDERLRGLCGASGPDWRIGEDERDGLVINRFRNEPGARYKNLGWHTD